MNEKQLQQCERQFTQNAGLTHTLATLHVEDLMTATMQQYLDYLNFMNGVQSVSTARNDIRSAIEFIVDRRCESSDYVPEEDAQIESLHAALKNL